MQKGSGTGGHRGFPCPRHAGDKMLLRVGLSPLVCQIGWE